jgi:hypothetical protein
MTMSFQREYDGNLLQAEFVPWDTKTFGFNVYELSNISIKDFEAFQEIWNEFVTWLNLNLVKLVSVRLASLKKKEIFFLQNNNFLVIENTCQPRISNLEKFIGSNDILLEEVSSQYLPKVVEIAKNSFDVSRFHSDPKINNKLANLRYSNWIENFPSTNKLWLTRKGEDVISFFLTEKHGSESYWHLTAVNNDFQGQGFGRKSWIKMLEKENYDGIREVKTKISMENLRILNLYSQLGAKFYNPETSLHFHN